MKHAQLTSAFLVAVLVGIGCGGKPQDASATAQTREPEIPVRLAQASAEAQSSAGGGSASVQGTVRFEGAPPKSGPVQMAADPVCQQQHASPVYSEEVVVNENGTLRHVFVYVKEGVTGLSPRRPRRSCWTSTDAGTRRTCSASR